ncbi:MAG: hypothetical protein LBF15_06295 [Candidatus Peribacteria bacterium]|nr:hypothetical protein [Candidatus Peribacteria bacterium]
MHKSPTATDLASQINSMMAPNLPVDEDRYIDFIAQNGAYIKINYPYLFRIQLSDNVTMERVAVELDKVLDIKSAEINDLITRSNPSSSSFSPAPGLSNNASVINLLKT